MLLTGDSMKIVLAPDSYKGSVSSLEACLFMEEGIRRVVPDAEIIKIPMADGGEGTAVALIEACGGKIISKSAKDPLGRDITATFALLNNKTAVIDTSAASGLPLLSENERNPMYTSTYGTGMLIKEALDLGCDHIIVGLGGSATNDGGIGMASALGAVFLDSEEKVIIPCGKNLSQIKNIDMSKFDKRIASCKVTAACDVSNVLFGETGASYIYAPQKGASDKEVRILDNGLRNYAEMIKQYLSKDVSSIIGGGAAGGLGAGIVAFLNGTLKKGTSIIKDFAGIDAKIDSCDLVITGEGKMDYQTKFGKAPIAIAYTAKKYNKPCIAICGCLGHDYRELYNEGFTGIFSITDSPMTLKECLNKTPELIRNTSESVMRIFII